MRFYEESYDRLIAQSKNAAISQRLFLVQEVNNEHDQNAIMLHDGERKIASVTADQARAIKKILLNTNDVIVCNIGYISSKAEFKKMLSYTVKGMYIVNERLARKFADQEIKGE